MERLVSPQSENECDRVRCLKMAPGAVYYKRKMEPGAVYYKRKTEPGAVGKVGTLPKGISIGMNTMNNFPLGEY